MFQIKDLNISHRKDLRPMISGLSLTLNNGDKAAIIGEEGNGKSTLLKWLCDPASIDDYTVWSGEVIGLGIVGHLAQEMSVRDKSMTVYEYLCDDDSFFLRSQGELSQTAASLGLQPEMFYSEQLVGTLSGGEKVKLQMAKVIARSPDLFLLDEPSNDIDIETLEWLERFINSQEVPVLYISHDETLLEHTANKIVHIELVRRKTVSRVTVAKCGYREYVTERMNSLEKQEQLARKEQAEYDRQQERWEHIYRRVERDQNSNTRQNPHAGRLLKKKMHAVKSMQKRFEREA
ncbi:MAG: ABC-F family ATP-binding cassette domain-containing protein, partial [Oscillospiraceae bacterium]|nr:ABC-F family ATP-binding cassette domain-containing protein [Oscillospiraceae bacterium]